MRKTKPKREAHVYDNTLKSLFGDEAAQIIPTLLPDAQLIGEQNIEVDRSKLKADLVYNITQNGEARILNIELQTSSEKDLALRLLQYYAALWAKYQRPVISVVLYPFKTSVPQLPCEWRSDEQVCATFSYRVFLAWEKDARVYVRKQVVAMYTFLPAMQYASVELLTQALAEMKRHYPRRRVFEQHLIRFVKVLERSQTMTEQEKKEIREVLRVQYRYDYFIDENPDVKERVIKGKLEGEQKGRLEGRLEGQLEGQIEASQQMVLDAVQASFPALMEMAKERVVLIRQPDALRQLAIQVLKAPDEASARQLFLVLGH